MTNAYNPLIEGMTFDILKKSNAGLTQEDKDSLDKQLKYLKINQKNKIDDKDKEKLQLPPIFKVGKLTYAQLEFYAGIKKLKLNQVFIPTTCGDQIHGKYVANFWKYAESELPEPDDLEKLPVVYLDEVEADNHMYRLDTEEIPPATWKGEVTNNDPAGTWKPFLVATAASMRASFKKEKVLAVLDENKEINWHKTLKEFLIAKFNWKYTIEHRSHALHDLVQNFAPHIRDGLEDL